MLLGISGKARSGKDTICGFLQELNPRLSRYAFADPIKETCRFLFGWDDRHLYGELKDVIDPEWGFSPRQAFQDLGTKFGRGLREDLWILKADKEYKKRKFMVIPDVRMENELEWLIAVGGTLIEVVRPAQEDIPLSNHISEKQLDLSGIPDNQKYRIENNEDLSRLLLKIELIYSDIETRRRDHLTTF